MCLGIPGRITETWQEGGAPMAHADFDGQVRRICLAYLPDLVVGDYVITHMGYALTRLTPEDAAATIAMMREYGVLQPAAAEAPAVPATPSAPDSAVPLAVCADDVCITCSDEGRPGEVITPPASRFESALVRTAAGDEPVDVSLVAPVSAGDLVLVHAGVAITRLGDDPRDGEGRGTS